MACSIYNPTLHDALAGLQARTTQDGIVFPSEEAMVTEAGRMMLKSGKPWVTGHTARVITRWERKQQRRSGRREQRREQLEFERLVA